MFLDELKCGDSAEIVELNGDEKLCKRLTALGFIKGSTLKLKRKVHWLIVKAKEKPKRIIMTYLQ